MIQEKNPKMILRKFCYDSKLWLFFKMKGPKQGKLNQKVSLPKILF
jgi:hypothetical protein